MKYEFGKTGDFFTIRMIWRGREETFLLSFADVVEMQAAARQYLTAIGEEMDIGND